jgi:hypothetical protein
VSTGVAGLSADSREEHPPAHHLPKQRQAIQKESVVHGARGVLVMRELADLVHNLMEDESP